MLERAKFRRIKESLLLLAYERCRRASILRRRLCDCLLRVSCPLRSLAHQRPAVAAVRANVRAAPWDLPARSVCSHCGASCRAHGYTSRPGCSGYFHHLLSTADSEKVEPGHRMMYAGFLSVLDSALEDSQVHPVPRRQVKRGCQCLPLARKALSSLLISSRLWPPAVFLHAWYVGGCQNHGPFLGPLYNTAPGI